MSKTANRKKTNGMLKAEMIEQREQLRQLVLLKLIEDLSQND